MEQHPIPQNISSYEFRLVGDMTLKQFIQLSIGLILALIIYKLPLINIIKYPLVFLAIVLGISLAFVPINGRPFARYIWAFLLAIYSPTQYYWRHQDTATPTALPPTAPAPQTPPAPAAAAPSPAAIPPVFSSTPSAAVESPSLQSSQTQYSRVPAPPDQSAAASSPALAPSPPPPLFSSPEDITKPMQEIYSAPPDQSAPPPPPETHRARLTPASVSATYTDLIIKPQQPNILTGLVVTPEGNPVENAIVEILNAATGLPARALRTNRLGQFQIATPLTDGDYVVQVDKPPLQFTPIRIQASGIIIEPVIVQPVS